MCLGYIWAFPIIAIASHQARKEMEKAQKTAPTTKQKGLDVVASKEVVVGLVLTPLFYLIYVVIGTIITELALMNGCCGGFGDHLRWIIPVALIVGIPLIVPISLVAGDRFWDARQAIVPIFLSFCNKNSMEELRATRTALQEKVRQLVAENVHELEFGERIIDFGNQDSVMNIFSESMQVDNM
eukprot:c8275_g1_i2.p2 GENE.c8275_g1_i2~~c8275_g1_i2.p2  ORF type:complete len:184 (-),score=56.75 c8275_g1_i2:82-633(-)